MMMKDVMLSLSPLLSERHSRTTQGMADSVAHRRKPSSYSRIGEMQSTQAAPTPKRRRSVGSNLSVRLANTRTGELAPQMHVG
jgi:hypothetical protein